MRWLSVLLFIVFAYQQVSIAEMKHKIIKRDNSIITLQNTVDQQGETITELKRGLHYQMRIAAVLGKVKR